MIRVVVPLISEADGDPVPGKRPHFLDKPVVQLLGPLNRSCMPELLLQDREYSKHLQRGAPFASHCRV